MIFALLAPFTLFFAGATASATSLQLPEFAPCSPTSEYLPDDSGSDLEFCADWNPEFPFNGNHCCRKVVHSRHRRHRGPRCLQGRRIGTFCGDMTDEQKNYIAQAQQGKLGDILSLIESSESRHSSQAYCTVNNGFLAYGRALVPSAANRIEFRAPDRCTEFGTDAMVGMLEWLGRQIAQKYSAEGYRGVRLVIGDISAPRGGCLAGRNGLSGHASHTTGQDADVGYLVVHDGKESPNAFTTNFDAKTNWWMAKQLFHNPFACVKVIFLDRRNIRKLARAAAGDEDWKKYGRFFRHERGHRNHMHVRIGDGPGVPGCTPNANPELEPSDEGDSPDEVELPPTPVGG